MATSVILPTSSQRCMNTKRLELLQLIHLHSRCSGVQAKWVLTLPSAPPNALVCQWGMADHTRPIWQQKTPINVVCQDGSSVFPSMRAATKLTGFPCKRASNTFVGKKLIRTSVLRRLYWPLSRQCTQSITGQMGSKRSPNPCTAKRHGWLRVWKDLVLTSSQKSSLTRLPLRLARCRAS